MTGTIETGDSTHSSHIMEKREESVPLISSRSEEFSGRKPLYRLIDDSELLLTICRRASLVIPRQPQASSFPLHIVKENNLSVFDKESQILWPGP